MSEAWEFVIVQLAAYIVVLAPTFGIVLPWMNRRHERKMREKYGARG